MRSDPSVAAAQAQRRAAPEETNGNVTVNAAVALLFIDFEHPNRLRVNGRASLHFDDPLLCEFAGAQLLVRAQSRALMQPFLSAWRSALLASGERRVRWSLDVDPQEV